MKRLVLLATAVACGGSRSVATPASSTTAPVPVPTKTAAMEQPAPRTSRPASPDNVAVADGPTAAEYAAAANRLSEPTFGCTVKVVRDYFQLRCPVAKGKLLDIGTVTQAGGTFEFAGQRSSIDTVTWTVKPDERMFANGFMFEDGMYELASVRDGGREWYLDGTWKPGGAELLRKTLQCCLERQHSANACFGRHRGEHALACMSHKDCASFDDCIEKQL